MAGRPRAAAVRHVGSPPPPSSSATIPLQQRACVVSRYQHRFRDAAIDGAMLLSLEVEDLADVLAVENPLHRRKIMSAIEELRALGAVEVVPPVWRRVSADSPATHAVPPDLREYGIDLGRMDAWTALLDQQRIAVIAKLKVRVRACARDTSMQAPTQCMCEQTAFDELDTNKDGTLQRAEMSRALTRAGIDGATAAKKVRRLHVLFGRIGDSDVVSCDRLKPFSPSETRPGPAGSRLLSLLPRTRPWLHLDQTPRTLSCAPQPVAIRTLPWAMRHATTWAIARSRIVCQHSRTPRLCARFDSPPGSESTCYPAVTGRGALQVQHHGRLLKVQHSCPRVGCTAA